MYASLIKELSHKYKIGLLVVQLDQNSALPNFGNTKAVY